MFRIFKTKFQPLTVLFFNTYQDNLTTQKAKELIHLSGNSAEAELINLCNTLEKFNSSKSR